MKIDDKEKNPFGKYLIITEDYGYSKNDKDRANLVIFLWNNHHDHHSFGLDIQKMEPHFVIAKNIYGWYDKHTKLPLILLPDVLKDPSGALKWRPL